MYVETLWMTVTVKSRSIFDLTDGFSKLDKFCKGSNVEGIYMFIKITTLCAQTYDGPS